MESVIIMKCTIANVSNSGTSRTINYKVFLNRHMLNPKCKISLF